VAQSRLSFLQASSGGGARKEYGLKPVGKTEGNLMQAFIAGEAVSRLHTECLAQEQGGTEFKLGINGFSKNLPHATRKNDVVIPVIADSSLY
jgi:hypothetical protein